MKLLLISFIISNIYIRYIYSKLHISQSFKKYINALKSMYTSFERKDDLKNDLDMITKNGSILFFKSLIFIIPYLILYVLCLNLSLNNILVFTIPILGYLSLVKIK